MLVSMPSLNVHYYLYLPTISFGKQNYDNEDTKYSMTLMSTVNTQISEMSE